MIIGDKIELTFINKLTYIRNRHPSTLYCQKFWDA